MLFIARKLSAAKLQSFTQQLACLLKAGFTLTEALDSLEQDDQTPKWQALLISLQAHTQQGMLLSESLAQFPKYFSQHYLVLIRCAERSGNLSEILSHLTQYQAMKINLKKKAWRAFAYPGFVLASSLSMSAGILFWVVPLFAQLFSQSNQNLPRLTQIILDFSQNFPSFFSVVSLSLITILYFGHLALDFYFPLRWHLSKFFCQCPGIARPLQILQMNHWLPLMAHYLNAGLPLFESLESAGPAFNQLYYQAAYQELLGKIAAGHSLDHCLKINPIFPKKLSSRISLGERSSNLSQAFHEAAEFYEQELQHFLNTLTQLIEPISLLFISVLIGILIIALYLPIFKMGEVF